MGLFWTTGNNYGREAAAFLNIKRSLYLTGTTTTAMKRPYWAFAENNYGREAPAFLLDYGREAAAFLNSSNINK
jgi:hypothetical protein